MQFYLTVSSACLVILLAFAYFYAVERKHFIGVWTLGLVLNLASYLLKALDASFYDSRMLYSGSQVSFLLCCLLLLYGTYMFVGKKVPVLLVLIPAAVSAIYLAVVWRWAEAADILIGITKSFLIIHIGVVFCKPWTDSFFERYVVGISFLLWGGFSGILIITGRFQDAGLWSNLVMSVLGLVSLIGILLSYFAKVKSELSASEKSLKENVNYLNTLIDNMNEVFFTYDRSGVLTFINKKCREVLGYQPDELAGRYVLDFVPDNEREKIAGRIWSKLFNGEAVGCETLAVHKNGSLRSVRLNASPILSNGEVIGGMALGEDITERKNIEHRLKYFSLHDGLTGLYNRVYFEQEMRRYEYRETGLPGIVICDVDGLKLINDIFGHDSGDMLLTVAADVIRRSFESVGTVMRIGGDEFAVLLDTCSPDRVLNCIGQLNEAVNDYNTFNPEIYLSLSVGYVIRRGDARSPAEFYKEADRKMYREKLSHNQSARSSVLQALMKSLETKDFLAEGHVERLTELAAAMTDELELSVQDREDLKLLVRFHDIGKVAISDSILFKPGPLTADEIADVQRHPEIGYRIAQSAPDLIRIADWILKHHEWWDGSGYPLGLKGTEIPLQSRIMSIIDAFDVITSKRPYGSALNAEQAIAELQRYAGIQFDPGLVGKFAAYLEKNAGKRIVKDSIYI